MLAHDIGRASAAAETTERRTHPLSPDSASALIPDPYRWVWENEDGASEGMTRFLFNLADAGKPVLFLAANSSIGNGGGLYHLFLRATAGGYRSLGLLPLQPEALQALTSKHFGLHDLKSCAHAGGGGYRCTTFVFDGLRYDAATTVEATGSAVPTEIRPAKIFLERSFTISAWKP